MAKPPSCLFLDQGREFIIFSNGCLDPLANLLIGNLVLVRNVQKRMISSQRPTFFSLTRCCRRPRFTGIQKYRNDKRVHQLHLWSKRYVVLSPNWLQLCKSYMYSQMSGLHNPHENLRFWAMIWNNCSEVLNKACYDTQLLPFYLDLPLDDTEAVCHQVDFLSTDLHLILCAGFVETFN